MEGGGCAREMGRKGGGGNSMGLILDARSHSFFYTKVCFLTLSLSWPVPLNRFLRLVILGFFP